MPSKSIFNGFVLDLVDLAVAVSAGISCQSSFTFSQSSFFNHKNHTSLLRLFLAEINPSFEPSALQNGLLSERGCMVTFTGFEELSTGCMYTSKFAYRSL